MTDFGGKLRQARERRGVSLRQIAAATKISVAALEALERNDLSRLPGGIFTRAFVRSYALEIGLDPDQTVREFIARFDGESLPPAAASRPQRPAVSEEGVTPRSIFEDAESAFEERQRTAAILLKIVVIGAALLGLILYFTLRGRT
jgi:cytoskeletal protein RodZ